MARHFALTVRLHDQRYHGANEWPPAPARVFQALVAGASHGGGVPAAAESALRLLETLPAPVIAAPAARRGQRVAIFVPNNDLDAVGGDPDRVEKIRTKKTVQPRLLETEPLFIYAWPLPAEGGEALVPLADGLYQLGRGVDPAWAVGEVVDDIDLARRLRAHRGVIHRPTAGEKSIELQVPTENSFASLVRRFEASRSRLRPGAEGSMNFVQPPKAHFAVVGYDGTARLRLFELRRESDPSRPAPWASWRATALIEHVRDMAVAALSSALPDRQSEIDRVLIGRTRDGMNAGSSAERVRIIPLPSIGHEHADQAIRRVLVQIPPGPLTEGDLSWALSGRSFYDPVTGEVGDTTLAEAPPDDMVQRYCVASRRWRSVTPLALGLARRRRIEPNRRREEWKPASERCIEERDAWHAVAQSLRHAGVDASLVGVHVQREPFDAHGGRAERYANGTRFPKEALWHIELELDRAISGPLVLGDGRFLGLGVMAPRVDRGLFAFDVQGGIPADVDTVALARALRRAVLARVQRVMMARGESELPPFFHGHAADGAPLRATRSSHLGFSVDVAASRLLIVPPHVLDGWDEPLRGEASSLTALENALEGFETLRAGRSGILSLRRSRLSENDVLLRRAKKFQSASDYVVCRHAKETSPAELVRLDIRRECERRRLPRPEAIGVLSVRGVPGLGVVARAELSFSVALPGPLLLGRTRFLGGGLFLPR